MSTALDEFQERDLAGMKNPSSWPLGVVLPLKKIRSEPGKFPDLGVLIKGFGPRVYSTNAYGLSDLPGVTLVEKLRDVEFVSYVSFEEVVREWRVD